MSTSPKSAIYRPGINAVLHEHEQMSAWLFFAVMSYLVMRFAPGCNYEAEACGGALWRTEIGLGAALSWGHAAGVIVLHSVVIGIWLLYCLKTASLFVRRSTAWAITGLMFVYCTDLWAGPSELNLVLQTISLYHLLVWARGKKNYFPPRHLVIAGMGVTVAMLTTPGAVVFWLPVIGHMLWVNQGKRLLSSSYCLGGLAAPWVILLLYALCTQSTAAPVSAYTPPKLAGAQDCLLLRAPLQIFVGVLPGFCQCWIPPVIALIPGHLLLFMWMRPFRKIRRSRKVGINTTLGTAFALVFWESFCTAGEAEFTAFYPFMLISLIGIILSVRRRIRNRTAKRVLRGIGLMVPFITLVVLLLVPLFRKATGEGDSASPSANKAASIEHIIQRCK